jgi:hypothetical protein
MWKQVSAGQVHIAQLLMFCAKMKINVAIEMEELRQRCEIAPRTVTDLYCEHVFMSFWDLIC